MYLFVAMTTVHGLLSSRKSPREPISCQWRQNTYIHCYDYIPKPTSLLSYEVNREYRYLKHEKFGVNWLLLPKQMKRSPDKRHKYTHGNLTDTFRHSQRSSSIAREYIYVNRHGAACTNTLIYFYYAITHFINKTVLKRFSRCLFIFPLSCISIFTSLCKNLFNLLEFLHSEVTQHIIVEDQDG